MRPRSRPSWMRWKAVMTWWLRPAAARAWRVRPRHRWACRDHRPAIFVDDDDGVGGQDGRVGRVRAVGHRARLLRREPARVVDVGGLALSAGLVEIGGIDLGAQPGAREQLQAARRGRRQNQTGHDRGMHFFVLARNFGERSADIPALKSEVRCAQGSCAVDGDGVWLLRSGLAAAVARGGGHQRRRSGLGFRPPARSP